MKYSVETNALAIGYGKAALRGISRWALPRGRCWRSLAERRGQIHLRPN